MEPDALREIGRAAHGSSDDPEVLDFSANTNPRVPDGVEAVYRDAFEPSRSYPPEPPAAYQEAAAAYVDCAPARIVPTPGGLAAIRAAIETTVQPGDSVVVPYPSFSEYAREVRLQGATPRFVPAEDVLEADPEDDTLAIVCQPNNPTGVTYETEALRAFAGRCRDAGTPLLIDEAFLGFTDQPPLAGTEGVIVARSLTKLFGLPGLRAGFAVATDEPLDRLQAARRSWNIDTPARAVGAFCMRQREFIATTRARVDRERTRLREGLTERFTVDPSGGPFLLVDVGDRDVQALIEKVRRHGIAVRDATTFRGLDSHIRIAVRLPEENDRLLEVLNGV